MDKKTINILYAEDSVWSATLVKMFTDQLSDELDIVLNLKHIKTYKNLKNEEKNVLEKAYDFLLLDNNLIGWDSEEFIKKILEQWSKTPIISMSWEEEISQKFNLPYIGKVWDIDELDLHWVQEHT